MSDTNLRSESETLLTLKSMARVCATVDRRFKNNDSRLVFMAWLGSVSLGLGVPISTAAIMVTPDMQLDTEALYRTIKSLSERARFNINSTDSDVDRGWRASCDNLCDAALRVAHSLGPRPEELINASHNNGASS